VIFATIEVLT